MGDHAVVSREDWVAARTQLLEKEKQLTRLRDELSRERRSLPWVKIDTQYVFDGPEGICLAGHGWQRYGKQLAMLCMCFRLRL
jgi:predicted dithiol-disulfide oxidoreductase (DUF899 family)